MKFLECKRLKGCNGDGCLLFDPSDENPLLCDCCSCHRSFHRAIFDRPPNSGACVKKHNGGVDGCQLFCPNVDNVRKCGACGCHRSLHQPLPSTSPSCSHKMTQNSVVGTAPSSQGDIMLLDDDDECLKEPAIKRLKLNDVVADVNGAPLLSAKVKVEFPMGETNLEITNMGVSDCLDADMSGIPKKLQKNWELLVKKYPECDFGSFVPRLSKDVKKGLSTWIIWCDPCQKEMCINPGKSFNLSNFEIHLQPKFPLKCGVSINKSKHEVALLEQRKVVESKVQAATAIELTELKRRSWIVKHTSEGNSIISFNFGQSLLQFYMHDFNEGVGLCFRGCND